MCSFFLSSSLTLLWYLGAGAAVCRSFVNVSPSDKLNAIYFHLFEHFANENGRNNDNNIMNKSERQRAATTAPAPHKLCRKETCRESEKKERERERLKRIGSAANWYRVLFLFCIQLINSNVNVLAKNRTATTSTMQLWRTARAPTARVRCLCRAWNLNVSPLIYIRAE